MKRQFTPALLFALLFSASPTAAQRAALVTPFAGGAFFLTDFQSRFGLRDVAVFGIHAELAMTNRFGVRAFTAFAPSAFDGAIQDEDVDILMFGGAAVVGVPQLHYRRSLVPVQPYLVAGAGAKRYSIDDGPGEGTDPMVLFGGGAFAPIGTRAGLRLELADYMSDAGEIQHDMLLTLGLSVSLW